MGQFVYTLMLAMATLFLADIKASWTAAQERAIARGAHIGKTPIGYVCNGHGDTEPSGVLTPDPVFGPAITALFDRAANTNDGDTALARWFGEQWPHPARRAWWANEIRRWLTNRVYLGELHYADLVNTEATRRSPMNAPSGSHSDRPQLSDGTSVTRTSCCPVWSAVLTAAMQ